MSSFHFSSTSKRGKDCAIILQSNCIKSKGTDSNNKNANGTSSGSLVLVVVRALTGPPWPESLAAEQLQAKAVGILEAKLHGERRILSRLFETRKSRITLTIQLRTACAARGEAESSRRGDVSAALAERDTKIEQLKEIRRTGPWCWLLPKGNGGDSHPAPLEGSSTAEKSDAVQRMRNICGRSYQLEIAHQLDRACGM